MNREDLLLLTDVKYCQGERKRETEQQKMNRWIGLYVKVGSNDRQVNRRILN